MGLRPTRVHMLQLHAQHSCHARFRLRVLHPMWSDVSIEGEETCKRVAPANPTGLAAHADAYAAPR